MLEDKHNNIIAAAKAAFEDKGYRVSMNDIAKRAGVAKQTLYNHFPSKEALFAEVIHDCGSLAASELETEGLSVETQLMRFALASRVMTMTPQGIAGYRAMTAEAHKFPEIAQDFYRQGAGALHQRLADFLCRADAQGQLCCPAPEFAADMLFSMLTGFERSRLLLGVAQENDGTDARVADIVQTFMRAFAAQNTNQKVD